MATSLDQWAGPKWAGLPTFREQIDISTIWHIFLSLFKIYNAKSDIFSISRDMDHLIIINKQRNGQKWAGLPILRCKIEFDIIDSNFDAYWKYVPCIVVNFEFLEL